MVDLKKFRISAANAPQRSLVRIIRAADRRTVPAEPVLKPDRTAVPVEVLAGRIRHVPRGRFVTGGKVEFTGQCADPMLSPHEKDTEASEQKQASMPLPRTGKRDAFVARNEKAQASKTGAQKRADGRSDSRVPTQKKLGRKPSDALTVSKPSFKSGKSVPSAGSAQKVRRTSFKIEGKASVRSPKSTLSAPSRSDEKRGARPARAIHASTKVFKRTPKPLKPKKR